MEANIVGQILVNNTNCNDVALCCVDLNYSIIQQEDVLYKANDTFNQFC